MKRSNGALILLFVVLLAACLGAMALARLGAAPASQVRVRVNGEDHGLYPLDQDAVITIAPADGSWYNILVISGGAAYIREADCPTQTCVQTPALSGDTLGIITCLPHAVTVELVE